MKLRKKLIDSLELTEIRESVMERSTDSNFIEDSVELNDLTALFFKKVEELEGNYYNSVVLSDL